MWDTDLTRLPGEATPCRKAASMMDAYARTSSAGFPGSSPSGAQARGRRSSGRDGAPDAPGARSEVARRGAAALPRADPRAGAGRGAGTWTTPGCSGAYLLFYWPVSYAQAREALGELPPGPRRCSTWGAARARWPSPRSTRGAGGDGGGSQQARAGPGPGARAGGGRGARHARVGPREAAPARGRVRPDHDGPRAQRAVRRGGRAR